MRCITCRCVVWCRGSIRCCRSDVLVQLVRLLTLTLSSSSSRFAGFSRQFRSSCVLIRQLTVTILCMLRTDFGFMPDFIFEAIGWFFLAEFWVHWHCLLGVGKGIRLHGKKWASMLPKGSLLEELAHLELTRCPPRFHFYNLHLHLPVDCIIEYSYFMKLSDNRGVINVRAHVSNSVFYLTVLHSYLVRYYWSGINKIGIVAELVVLEFNIIW